MISLFKLFLNMNPNHAEFAVSASPTHADPEPNQINISVHRAASLDNRRNKVEFGAGKLRVAK